MSSRLIRPWPPYLDDLDHACLDEFGVAPASPATEEAPHE